MDMTIPPIAAETPFDLGALQLAAVPPQSVNSAAVMRPQLRPELNTRLANSLNRKG
jgi:hypothetical protein